METAVVAVGDRVSIKMFMVAVVAVVVVGDSAGGSRSGEVDGMDVVCYCFCCRVANDYSKNE